MYDTEKRVALVKKRIAEHRRRQVRRSIRSLSAPVRPAVPIPCGNGRDGAGPADGHRRNVRRNLAA